MHSNLVYKDTTAMTNHMIYNTYPVLITAGEVVRIILHCDTVANILLFLLAPCLYL